MNVGDAVECESARKTQRFIQRHGHIKAFRGTESFDFCNGKFVQRIHGSLLLVRHFFKGLQDALLVSLLAGLRMTHCRFDANLQPCFATSLPATPR